MPRKKVVTSENIHTVAGKLKRIKKHQNNKEIAGETESGHPVYHYPTITKALIARVLGVSSDYLTSIKDPKIKSALKYFGQRRTHPEEALKDSPKLNTKRYFELKALRMSKENKRLIKKIEKIQDASFKVQEIMFNYEQSIQVLNDARNDLRILRSEKLDLETQNKMLRVQNASMKLEIDRLKK